MADPAKPARAKKPRPPNKVAPAFRLLDDGSISNKRVERFALFMVDGQEPSEAWVLTGGRNASGSWAYRRMIETYPVFQERLAVLTKEHEELMADDVFGEAKWMANQMWREARATGNATMMQKAAEMRMKIMERELAGAPGPQSGVATQRNPGRPSVENPQVSAGMADVRQRLIQAGVPTPGSKSDDPAPKAITPASAKPVVESDLPIGFPQGAGPDLEAMLARAIP